ncbi:MAG: hypothetical protein BGO70_16905 [Bacteroidetes bacterium 43-93]|nr:hypothetical protein [Bacteroidota bacterium]OJX01433.1 MAG: hypothetical protein BGO70_16905 [Bacteroidetes bacterium 43-93]
MSPAIQYDIHVFKTNIDTETDSQIVGEVLNTHEDVMHWSVDLNDVDRVLRIVTCSLHQSDIISLINQQGYQCSELQ